MMWTKNMYMLLPIWSQTLFRNRQSPYGKFWCSQMAIPITIRGSPYGNIYYLGIFTRLPIWSLTRFRNGFMTELSLYRNGYPLWCGNPRTYTGIGLFLIPIWEWSIFISIWGCACPRFYMVIPGNPCFHAGIDVCAIPV
jgi:hypothetical protein